MATTTTPFADLIAKRVKPCGDQVFIEKLFDEKTKSGLILVRSQTNSLPTERGRVVAVGPGKWESGKFIETLLKAGQEILFHSYPSGCEVKEDGKEYTLIAERQVVAVLA